MPGFIPEPDMEERNDTFGFDHEVFVLVFEGGSDTFGSDDVLLFEDGIEYSVRNKLGHNNGAFVLSFEGGIELSTGRRFLQGKHFLKIFPAFCVFFLFRFFFNLRDFRLVFDRFVFLPPPYRKQGHHLLFLFVLEV